MVNKQEAHKKQEEKPDKEQDIKSSETEYGALLKERDDYKDKYYRLAAEFENARKRMDKEHQQFVKYANEQLITEFLDVLDNLERSWQVAQEKYRDDESYLKGLKMVIDEIYALLERNGVKPIEACGKPFDPNYHEVLIQEENNQAQENTVLEELQKGYLLEDKVIRTAKVKITCENKDQDNSGDSEPVQKIEVKTEDD